MQRRYSLADDGQAEANHGTATQLGTLDFDRHQSYQLTLAGLATATAVAALASLWLIAVRPSSETLAAQLAEPE